MARTARDSVLRFNVGDWVEITDDARELDGRPGEMRRVENVTDETRAIELAAALPVGEFAPETSSLRVICASGGGTRTAGS